MTEKEGLVGLRLIASDQPTAAPSPVVFAPSVELILIPCSGYAGYCVGLRPMAEKEGFEPPVPFQVQLISSQSHSATLPLLLKIGQESRLSGFWQASTDGQSHVPTRGTPRNGHCFLSCPEGTHSRNPYETTACGGHHLRAVALRLPLLLKIGQESRL